MPIDVFCSQPHYADHILPIWHNLGQNMGIFWVGGRLGDMPDVRGIPNRRVATRGVPAGGPVLVAGFQDEQQITRPVIYLEHGAGQTYRGDPIGATHEAYSGSPGHRRPALFLCPSETVADRWRVAYPRVPAVAVGCPKLDVWHAMRIAGKIPHGNPDRPVVAFTFHADNRLCAESNTAFPHYQPHLESVVATLASAGVEVIGHGHPNLWRTLGPFWAQLGVRQTPDLHDVIRSADVLVGDNTSALPEFASVGKPIVFMNAPWYRRSTNHGGRFWEWPEGQEMVDDAVELPAAILRALADPPAQVKAREEMLRKVYVACDGLAAHRAVKAIEELVGRMDALVSAPASQRTI